MWVVVTDKYDTKERRSKARYFDYLVMAYIYIAIKRLQGKRVSIIKD